MTQLFPCCTVSAAISECLRYSQISHSSFRFWGGKMWWSESVTKLVTEKLSKKHTWVLFGFNISKMNTDLKINANRGDGHILTRSVKRFLVRAILNNPWVDGHILRGSVKWLSWILVIRCIYNYLLYFSWSVLLLQKINLCLCLVQNYT